MIRKILMIVAVVAIGAVVAAPAQAGGSTGTKKVATMRVKNFTTAPVGAGEWSIASQTHAISNDPPWATNSAAVDGARRDTKPPRKSLVPRPSATSPPTPSSQ